MGWFEIGAMALIGTDLVLEAMENMKFTRKNLRNAQMHQKSYFDVRRDLEFHLGDWVFVKVLTMKGMMQFDKKKKATWVPSMSGFISF